MAESTRPLPPLVPLSHGGWEVNSFLSSPAYTIRGLGLMPSNTIVPVIVVPGMMGSNLRAKLLPRLGRIRDERNELAKPGEPVWRPPNGVQESIQSVLDWRKLLPESRQKLFSAASLEVDGTGPVSLPDADDGYVLTQAEVRQRGWGEVHADSYGRLLYALQMRLNQTFRYDERNRRRLVNPHWKAVMACDPRRWGVREFAPLTEAHLVKHAAHYYPVYCVGYNWLEDCGASSKRLEQRILEILAFWTRAKRRCDKVVLVTHSMGGLVARACAKRIPDKIAGIIHGVMPALGAPAAYRRIACGTETSNPSNGAIDDVCAHGLAKILGDSPEQTTPVLATSPGVLEMLPNHLYPQPWLHVRVMQGGGATALSGGGAQGNGIGSRAAASDYLRLPGGKVSNPYDLYRDMSTWYRLVNPALADPMGKYRKDPRGVQHAIESAIGIAEDFHRSLGDYYHPNTYVFYGDDRDKLSYSQVRWIARHAPGSATALTAANIATARFLGHSPDGQRRVLVGGKTELHFRPEPQDAHGDGTVPHQSGAGPAGKVKQLFAARGVDHQNAYKHEDIIMLTLRLVVKIVQETP
ncbi:esterase/lipase family protein [Massilia niastensis]|uniref:esterase/lipase family protein n=1 Tax=Massilia niastensis TaxID=544911 RepID=UPI0003730F0C|nr:hypothetical protein [Massilia niastensis]